MKPTILAITALTCCLFAPRLKAEEKPAEPAAPPLAKLIGDLSSPQYSTRDAAMTALMTREGLSESDLAAGFKSATPELRHRLTRVALHRFFQRIKTPAKPIPNDPEKLDDEPEAPDSPGLGVDLSRYDEQVILPHENPALKTPAVLVTSTLPGFPAYAHLRPGDMILSIDGQTLDDEQDTRRFTELLTQRFKPGQSVTLTVMRDGKLLPITLKLDSKKRLDAVFPGGPESEDTLIHRTDFQDYLTTLTGQTVEHSFEIETSGESSQVKPAEPVKPADEEGRRRGVIR